MRVFFLTAVAVVFYAVGWLPGATIRAGGWIRDAVTTGYHEGRHGRQEVTE